MTKRPRFGGFCECGDHAWAYVARCYVTLVSPDDAHLLQDKIWTRLGSVDRPYANRKQGGRCFLLHREVMGATKGMVVDHIDGNGLNNRRDNLRFCTHAENIRNQRRHLTRSLPKGVRQRRGRFFAHISPNGRMISLGSYTTAEEAAAVYDAAAVAIFGEFARTNKSMGII